MCCRFAVPNTMKLTFGGREVVKDSGMNGQNIKLIRLFNEALKEGKNSANDHFQRFAILHHTHSSNFTFNCVGNHINVTEYFLLY